MSGKIRQGTHQPKGCWIRKEKRLAIYIRDNFKCVYCGKDLRNVSANDITLDHLVPKSYGGSNSEINLITACKSCNCGRGNKAYYQYATKGAVERIESQIQQPLNMKLAIDIIRGYTTIEELQ
jgi:5-methylcytosine-specific restriction endonuclease McrA